MAMTLVGSSLLEVPSLILGVDPVGISEAGRRIVPHSMPMLRVADLEKAYAEQPALRGVDLCVAEGEIVALLGPNGAGKTTLSSIVAGLIRPDKGRVEIDGVDVARSSGSAARALGYAPQAIGIYMQATVRENLSLFGRLAGLWGPALRAAIDRVAHSLGLEPLLERLASQLSGGQQRRVHNAIAMIRIPKLLVLDEASVGLDVEARVELLRLVRAMADEGTAVLYSTHHPREAEDLAASVCILEAGRVVARDSVQALIDRHSRTFVEFAFDGEPPTIELTGASWTSRSRLRIPTQHPAQFLAEFMSTHREVLSTRLESIEILKPSLENVYLQLTGHRVSADGTILDGA